MASLENPRPENVFSLLVKKLKARWMQEQARYCAPRQWQSTSPTSPAVSPQWGDSGSDWSGAWQPGGEPHLANGCILSQCFPAWAREHCQKSVQEALLVAVPKRHWRHCCHSFSAITFNKLSSQTILIYRRAKNQHSFQWYPSGWTTDLQLLLSTPLCFHQTVHLRNLNICEFSTQPLKHVDFIICVQKSKGKNIKTRQFSITIVLAYQCKCTGLST